MNPKELGKEADKLQDALEEAKKRGDLEAMAEVVKKLREIKLQREASKK